MRLLLLLPVAVAALLAGSHVLSLLAFTRGFLTTRVELRNRSSCSDRWVSDTKADPQGCWLPASYDKAVFVILDALRADFLFPEPSKNASSWQPALPRLREAIAEAVGAGVASAVPCMLCHATRALLYVHCLYTATKPVPGHATHHTAVSSCG